jgi:hypothetical protein
MLDNSSDTTSQSTTIIEYNRKMRLIQDLAEIEAEQSSVFKCSPQETPRFNDAMLNVPKAKQLLITFGSGQSSPISDIEASTKYKRFETPRSAEVDEVSWEDSSNKRDYILTLPGVRKESVVPATEELNEKSSSISLSQLFSLEIDSPYGTFQNTAKETRGGPRQEPQIMMESIEDKTCCGNCFLHILR